MLYIERAITQVIKQRAAASKCLLLNIRRKGMVPRGPKNSQKFLKRTCPLLTL